MITKTTREIPLFESLGIFTEASKKKRKPRIISVRPIRKDYTTLVDSEEEFDIDDIDSLGDDFSDYDSLDMDLGDDFSDEELLNDSPIEGDEDLDDIGIDDIPDFEDDGPDTQGEEISSNDEEPVEGEDLDTTEPIPEQSTNDEPPSEEEQPTETPVEPVETADEEKDQSNGGEEVIDATGGEDPEIGDDLGAEVDIAPADGTDPNTMPVEATPTDQTSNESITKDDMRKYELFKRFMNLYNSIQYFIEKLENGVTDNNKFEFASNKALKKFKSIEELTKDYMILKFQNDSFLQNSFFYEKIKASSLLLLELLKLNKNNNDEK